MEKDRVLVLGAGKSGVAAASLLLKTGEKVAIYDSNAALDTESVKSRLPQGDVKFILGSMCAEDIADIKLAVISPGIPVDADFLGCVRAAGIRILGEIELAYRHAGGTLIAITGTNGKTTTTALTGAIMAEYFKSVFVVGNIGDPYTDFALDMGAEAVTVAEISSFQLETATTFHPHISAILNITPDHLNRHGDMATYTAVKESIAKNQTAEDYIVLNYEDDALRAFGQEKKVTQVIFFSSKRELEEGLFLRNGAIVARLFGKEQEIVLTNELNILGRHNHENAMAAIGMALCMGVPAEVIRHACRSFKAVEHRIEFVCDRDGVKYYNDSKGTNPDAAIQAVRAMPGPILLIAGGYDKNSEYDEWIEAFDGRVKHMALIGQTAEKIADCAKKHGFSEVSFSESLEEAVSICEAHAAPGDNILLSPACASWGMFKNYEERGRMFKEIALKGQKV